MSDEDILLLSDTTFFKYLYFYNINSLNSICFQCCCATIYIMFVIIKLNSEKIQFIKRIIYRKESFYLRKNLLKAHIYAHIF